MRVLTFSRVFPRYHPKAGQPTHFVEKIWKSLYINGECPDDVDRFIQHYQAQIRGEFAKYNEIHMKGHTIRAGHRWKAGDWFSPRVWYEKAYRSPQIQFAPPIQVKKVWNFTIDECGVISIGGLYLGSDKEDMDGLYEELAKNDGLSEEDLLLWFPLGKRFDGQIICWNDKIEY